MSKPTNKPIASLSLDLDNKWSYMKTHGDSGWESFPSYLDIVVPRVLRFLKERDLSITFFIVGQDAALEKNHEVLSQIPKAGHEVGNHSFNHEPWLHLYSRDELDEEFIRSEAAIAEATGEMPKGFRGPGFSLSPTVLEVLTERGYDYDCSTFPTFIAPLARAYYFFNAVEMSEKEKEKRKLLFGKFSDGFAPLKPYRLIVNQRSIIEIPVTTLPIAKTPIHLSYLIYLSTFSKSVALAYWKTAIRLCKAKGIQPSILLHPLDFMTADDAPELSFFPGMRLSIENKIELVSETIGALSRHFDIVSMADFVGTLEQRTLPVRENVSGNELFASTAQG